MARCAGCLTTFSKNDRRIVADTEVFHDRCIELIPTSLTNKLKRKVIDLDARNKVLENAQQEANRMRVSVDDANADARRVRADNDRLTRELCDLRAAAKTAASSGEYFRDRVDRLELEKESLVRRAEAAERELALLHTLSGQRQQAPPATSEGQKSDPQSNKDDTEIRFSLLELDPPK